MAAGAMLKVLAAILAILIILKNQEGHLKWFEFQIVTTYQANCKLIGSTFHEGETKLKDFKEKQHFS